jgi:hypothetical protein
MTTQGIKHLCCLVPGLHARQAAHEAHDACPGCTPSRLQLVHLQAAHGMQAMPPDASGQQLAAGRHLSRAAGGVVGQAGGEHIEGGQRPSCSSSSGGGPGVGTKLHTVLFPHTLIIS